MADHDSRKHVAKRPAELHQILKLLGIHYGQLRDQIHEKHEQNIEITEAEDDALANHALEDVVERIEQVTGIDPDDLREVSLRLSTRMGLKAWPKHPPLKHAKRAEVRVSEMDDSPAAPTELRYRDLRWILPRLWDLDHDGTTNELLHDIWAAHRSTASEAELLEPSDPSPAPPAKSNVFEQQGQFWKLVFVCEDGTIEQPPLIPHRVAFLDVRELLSNPDNPPNAVSLWQMRTAAPKDVVIAGGMPASDEDAVRACDDLLDRIPHELEAAREAGDIEKIVELEDQETKARAYKNNALRPKGGGREEIRTVADPKYRIVRAVTKGIKEAIEAIRGPAPKCAEHLESSLSYGSAPKYSPSTKTEWTVC